MLLFIANVLIISITIHRYIRLNRTRIKGEYGQEDALVGLNVLYEVLSTMCLIMAPFTPFFTEYIYQYIRKLHPSYQSESVPGEQSGRQQLKSHVSH